MSDQAEQLKARTKQFAVRIFTVVQSLPRRPGPTVIARQILRSGTSVAANYRAACRARSRAEFVSKLGVVIEEADETVFWLEMLVDTKTVPERKLRNLLDEANQLVAIFTASKRTAEGASGSDIESEIGNRQSELAAR